MSLAASAVLWVGGTVLMTFGNAGINNADRTLGAIAFFFVSIAALIQWLGIWFMVG